MDKRLQSHSIVVAAQDQVSCDLGGETVILNLSSGVYYGLRAVGFRIWNLVENPITVNDIRDILLQEFEVDAQRCERDLLALLQEMSGQGLIEMRDKTPA